MPVTTSTPGLDLDDELHAEAAAGIAEHLPELGPLSRDTFTSRSWTLVPDEQTGQAYKAELPLVKTDTRTVKLNLWFLPDLRGDEAAKPHNHPWDFVSHTLMGSLRERRWVLRDGVVVPGPAVEYRAGREQPG